MKDILITGSYGQLGQEIQVELAKRNISFISTSRANFDICNIQQAKEFLRDIRPEAIINCAAYTDVDTAETDTKRCYQINAMGAYIMACFAAIRDIPLMHFSSDYVFSGDAKEPYHIHDLMQPINAYGRSKRDSELFLLNAERVYVVRLSSVFGRSKINFVNKIIEKAKKNETIKAVNDKTSLIGYATDLAPMLVDLLFSGAYGTYHLGNVGAVNRFDWARYVIACSRFKTDVVAIPSTELALPAKRPTNSVLDISDIIDVTRRTPPDWQDATKRFVQLLHNAMGYSL